MPKYTTLASVYGFSIIGLLLSSAIGIIILGTLLQTTLYSSVEFKQITKKFQQQRDLLTTEHYIRQDIHNSGFEACLSATKNRNPIETCNIHSCDNLPSNISELIRQHAIQSNSTILILQDVIAMRTSLTQNMQHLTDTIHVADASGLHIGDDIRICDYKHFDEFKISALYENCLWHQFPLNNSSALQNVYNSGTLIYRSTTIIYYLKRRGDSYTLYRDDANRQAIGLIDNLAAFNVQLVKQDDIKLVQVELIFNDNFNSTLHFSLRNRS
jgi:Tfp pilus assembly protein PilW